MMWLEREDSAVSMECSAFAFGTARGAGSFKGNADPEPDTSAKFGPHFGKRSIRRCCGASTWFSKVKLLLDSKRP